jgi:hypothetical protein
MRRNLISLFAVFILLSFPLLSFSQVTTASIKGKVVDNEGVAVAGASVTAKNIETGMLWRTTTSRSGVYHILSVPPGKYEIEVKHEAYGTQIKSVELLLGQTAVLDFTLALKSIQVEVEVVAEAPATELKKSELSVPITREQISSLPLNGRNFLEIATLAPGIKPGGGGVGGGGITSGAALANNMGFLIDGADQKNEIVEGGMAGNFWATQDLNPFPLDAIQEYRVISQLFKAEYFKSTAGMVSAISKSGTNELHGSLFYSFRDKSLNARGVFESEKPDYRRHQVSFSLGGPIIKDKFHFFLAYEGSFLDQFYTSVPGGIYANLGGTWKTPSRANLSFLRLTYQPSSRHLLDFSFHGRIEKLTNYWAWWGPLTKDGGINFDSQVYNVVLKHQFMVSSSVVNELKFHYQKYNWKHSPLSTATCKLYPSVMMGGWPSPQNWYQDRFGLYDDLTYALDKHVFKFGFFIQNVKYFADQQLYKNSMFFFSHDGDTVPYQVLVGAGTSSSLSNKNTQLGVYVQDDWTVTRELTLNIGLRWDYESNMLNRHFVTPDFVKNGLAPYINSKYFSDGTNRKPYLKAFQPRFGFSYDISKKQSTFITGGFGVYYDRTIWNAASDEALRYTWKQYTIPITADGAPGTLKWDEKYYNYDELLKAITLGTLPPPEVMLIPSDLKTPYSIQYSLGIRQRIKKDMNLSVSYVGTRGYNEITCYNISWSNPIPGFGPVVLWTDAGKSWYDGVYISFDRPYKPGQKWGLQISYTLGWAYSCFNGFYYGYWRYTSPTDLKKAPTLNDERHRISISGIVDLPWGLQLSGWAGYASGARYDVLVGEDVNHNGTPWDDWPPEGRNSGKMSPTKFVNLRISKNITVGRSNFALFLDAFNVFNWKNYNSYPSFKTAANFGKPIGASDPRQVQLGAKINF